MSEALVFNHHSLPFQDTRRASDSVLDFLKICIDAQNTGFSVILLDQGQDPTWFSMELAPGYFWRDWHSMAALDPKMKDQVSAFRSIQTRSPLFNSEDIGGDLELFDVIEAATGKVAPALRAAAWYESPLISFPSQAPWNRNPLEIHIDRLQEENGGEVERQTATLANFYSFSEWGRAKPSYAELRTKGIQDGVGLWAEKNRILPCLGFCGKTQPQFNNWSHPANIFEQVKASLLILNQFCQKWQKGEVADYSHAALKAEGMNRKVSSESDSVTNHPSKKRVRTFYLPDGKPAYFESHIKIGNQYRIHFYPDSHTKKIWIGYVGPHLPL